MVKLLAMKSLVSILLLYPKTVIIVLVGIAALGFSIFRGLPVDVFPDIQAPRVVVQTEAGGLTAEEVESRITTPIESAMNGIPGVTTVRSSSGGGLSFVWVDFDWSVDLSKARFAVFERLSTVRESLPSEADPEIAPNVSVTGEIMLVALTSPSNAVSQLSLRELGEYDLRTRLMGVPGIGEVVVIGGQLPECRVSVDPRQLMGIGVTINDVIESVRDSRTLASAGYLPNSSFQEVPVRQMARADATNDLARVVVHSDKGVFRLCEVADVSIAGAPRRGSASFGGIPAVVLSVQKIPGGNTPELTRQLDQVLDEFAAIHAKDGIEVHREAYRQADFIGMSIEGGKSVVRDAVLIVILVLALTIMKPRTILVTLVTMPLSILLGVAMFPVLGLGVNVMTLGGLAVAAGDIVDCAIIFGEIIWRRLAENGARDVADRMSVGEVITASMVEVFPGVVFSTMIIVLVFLPLLLLSGLESGFFRPLALSYLAIFAASFVVSCLAVPTLSRLLWRESFKPLRSGGESIAVRMLKCVYQPFLLTVVRFPRFVLLLSLAAFVASIYLSMSLGSSFLPSFREDSYNVFVSTPPGTSLDETERVTESSVSTIAAIDGVLSVCRRTGRAERDQHAEPVSTSELVVRVDPKADADAVATEIRDGLSSTPGISVMIGYPIAHRISAVLSGVESELAISIFGDSLEVLRDSAKRAKAVLDTISEVVDARANREIMTESLRIDYDLEAMSEVGLTLKEAGEQVSAGFNGVVVGTIHDGMRRRDVVVRADSGLSSPSAEDLKSFLIVSRTGRHVRLDEIARVVPEETSSLIVHEGLRRKALVSCNIKPGANVGELVQTLRERLDPVIRETGCTISYGGSYSARESAVRRLGVLGVALIVAIFATLVFALKSPRSAILALINVPLSLIGGIIAVKLSDPVLSVSSIVGFVTVIGFTLRNGILLINRFDELVASGILLKDAVRKGAMERMVPVLMTSLTTVVGLIPIVLGGNRLGGELLAPLAVVQLGGLVGATLLTLMVLPAAAVLIGRSNLRMTIPMFLVTLLALSGCKTYAPDAIDWEREISVYGDKTVRVRVSGIADLERLALIGNKEINMLRLQSAKSESVSKDTGWWEDPELEFDLNRIVNPSESPWLGGVSMTFTIPLSGAPRLEAEAAKFYSEADVWAVKSAERKLMTNVRKAVSGISSLVKKRDMLGAYLNDPALTNALKRLDSLSFVGEIPRADFVAARREYHARMHAHSVAASDVRSAALELNGLLGFAPNTIIDGLEDISLDLTVTAVTDRIPALEFMRHPSVKECLARFEASERSLEAEIRKQYPELKLGPAYSQEESTDRFGVVGGLTLPLWNRNRKAIAEAEGDRKLARQDAIDAWRSVVFGYGDALQRYCLAKERLESCSAACPVEATRQSDALREIGEIDDREYLSRKSELLDSRLLELEAQETCAEAIVELNGFTMED